MTHSLATRGSLWLHLWLLVILTGNAVAAEELPQPLFPGDEWLRGDPVEIVPDFIVRGQAPRPAQPFDVFSRPQQTFDPGQERPGSGFGGLDVTLASPDRPGTMEVATGSGTATQAPTTVTEMLEGSSSIQTTNILRRSPIALEPYVRGYSMGQIYGASNGAYWTSARADLDSILSKMDPSLVEQMVVIPGPYGLRYGPGFAFIDIMPMQTPRYACGPENHNRAALTFRGNGGQVYGTDTVYGGAERYGYAVTYGKRVGSDYQAGNGLLIPSGYDVGNLTGQIGFDIGEDNHLELRYQSMDQRDTEYAGQFFDVDSLMTNAFSLGYVKGEPDDATRLEATGWYNRTEFAGTTLGADKRQP